VLFTFTEQVVLIHKHYFILNSHDISNWTVTMKQRKRQRRSYLNTLPLHIYGVPHWPGVILKKHSGVLFHTLYVRITVTAQQKNFRSCQECWNEFRITWGCESKNDIRFPKLVLVFEIKAFLIPIVSQNG